ncbi:MAG TPA: fumarate hydratase, partial [Candidatus Omnitrophica bacterium]|nr:fumarate hydratase [Candidatus Omnitrophota bacterium]
IHTELVRGRKVKVSVLPKGFGCENKAKIAMFNPTAKLSEIKDFIVDVVRGAGSDACPPYIVGVGIGGTQDYAALLAKKALLCPISRRAMVWQPIAKAIAKQSKLEADLLNRINKLNIGPMGLGGKNTCLAVNIQSYPTHIAGLPVAVNISCHALRSATKII